MGMPTFSEILSKRSVFKNRDILSPHHVPNQLLYRERELESLMRGVAPALKGSKPRNIFLYGKSGCGKTASVKHVLKALDAENKASVQSVYMNCRVYDTRYKVLQKVISDFQPDFARTGHSFAVLYEKLLDWLEDGPEAPTGKQLLVVLDEVDVVKDLDNLLYTLTRANDDLKKGNVSVVGVSNKVNFKERLDARAKSSLCEQELVFQAYDAPQLKGILEQRVPHAFEDSAVDDGAVSLSAAIAAGENGDARYALNLLLRAGELAENKSKDKVTDREVEEARRLADEDKAFDVIGTLPEHLQLVLYSLANLATDIDYRRLVEEGGDKYYFSGEVYERYCRTSRSLAKEPRTSRWYREYLHELETLGLITTIESGRGIRGHATLVHLSYDPSKVKNVIEKTLLKPE